MPDNEAASLPPAPAMAEQKPAREMPPDVPVLDSSAWREYRGQPGKATHNSNHIAVIADGAGVLRRCFVKLAPNPKKPTLLCEALGWVLAGHAGLRRADFVAIVLVDKKRLAECQPLPDECLAAGDLIPAWCSSAIPGQPVNTHQRRPPKPAGPQFHLDYKAFMNTADARKIAAFDLWTDLRDRNLGNVIRMPTGGYASIDHETLLDDVLWTTSPFLVNSITNWANKDFDEKKLKVFKSDMARAAAGHADALEKARASLNAILLAMLSDNEKRMDVIEFLETRSKRGWLAHVIGVLDTGPTEDNA